MRESIFRFHDQDRIEGTQDVNALEQERRELELARAMKSGLPEIPRNRLQFGRYQVEDEQTGEFYSVLRGAVMDVKSSSAIAFFVDAGGNVVYLEPAPGARNRDELATQREATERARAERMRPRVRR